MMFSRLLRMLSFSLKINLLLILRLIVLCSFFFLFSFIPKADEPLAKLVFNLQRWTDSIPQEKVYLHMDKPYYALGDTIWFKGYVTIGSRHQLSALSGAVYVDLINDKDSVVKALKLPVTAGMVMGDFTLIDDYKEGSYRIRAYTQWMRNAGPEYFFDRTFTVGDLLSHNLVAKADYQYKDVNNKQVLTALLNFTDDDGRALGERNVRYQIIINKKMVWTQNLKTDALGSIRVNIDNENKTNLAGAYIRAIIEGSDKYPIIRDFPIKANQTQTDVQFFPESGNLVNGITSKVAFKAVGVDGLGIAIKGSIVDEGNKEVCQFTTLHAGMGNFALRPQTGKTYSAKISFADGSTKTIALPAAVESGYTLNVYQPGKDSLLVRINASQQLLSKGEGVSIIAQTGGESIFSSTIKIAKPITAIWLNKKDFPSGIAQFTLFNNAGEPVNERIAFIRSKDQMELDIKTTRNSYKSKEHVKIELNAKDSKGKPTSGNFSVTIIDEGKMPVEESKESTIFSNLLLTSDLKGYIEQPNYYFTKETDEVNRALDNLMLTQGYRRFAWKELSSLADTKPKYKAEGLGSTISGRVFTLTNKPLPNATVTLMSIIAGVTKFTNTDSVGRFKFDGIFMTDSIKFTVQARGAKNTDKVKILIDAIPEQKVTPNGNLGDVNTNIAGTLKQYIDNGKKLDDIYEQTGQLDKVHRLREVRIKARKPTPPPYANQAIKIPEGYSDQVIMMDPNDTITSSLGAWLSFKAKTLIFKELRLTREGVFIPLYPYMKVPGVTEPVPMNIMLNGRKVGPDEAEGILEGFAVQPESIYKIEIVRTSPALLRILGGATVMFFTKRDYVRKNYTPSIANITPKGYNKVREFYQPRYDKPGSTQLPDLRTTIYWNPYLKTDINGQTAFNFFNADGPGSYKVIVEGINADGELGRQVYRYTVDAGQATTGYTLPPTDKTLSRITAPLDSFNRRFPAEKVYLHTDKPYYSIGDTLWFKSYLLDKVNFAGSKISKLLYVELYSDTTGLVRRISVPIKDGVGAGQIALIPAIFKDGGYTLRAYTNWMQNFGDDYIFNRSIYLSKPSGNTWLVKSNASINRVADKDQLTVDIKLNRPNNLLSPIALKKVEVKIFDEWHYIYKEEMQTGIDGSLKLSQNLDQKSDWRKLRVQLTSLEKTEGKILQIPLNIDRGYNIDLQFLPEGGQLVAGLKSTIGIKAIGMDGRGTAVSGAIYNDKGQEVVSFVTMHKGMGSFEFTPKHGERYVARIIQSPAKIFQLPDIKATGTVMHISNAQQDDNLHITLTGLDKLVADSACYLIGTSRGVIYYSQKIDLNKPDVAVAKNVFPSGVARFTLFIGRKPLNERAVYIDTHDQLNINIYPHKTSYNTRDSVSLQIEVKDKTGIPVNGSFSLAVTDDSQVKPDSLGNFNMVTSLQLNSELKGYIEDPGYYIVRKDKQAWQALDNLMLTQGWTGYAWNDVFMPKKTELFEAEKEFKISGKLVGLTNKPLPNQSVLISSQKPAFITTTGTDSTGRFLFKNLPVIDSGSFFLQGKNKKGKDLTFGMLIVDRFKAPEMTTNLTPPLMPWYINSDTLQINYAQRKIAQNAEKDPELKGNVLKEVKINAKKIIKDSMNPYGPGNSDISLDEKDIKESAAMSVYDLLIQKLPDFKGVGKATRTWREPTNVVTVPTIRFGDYTVGKRDLLIDGWPLVIPPDADVVEELKEIKAATIKGIEVIYSRPYTNRSIIADGGLEMNFNRAGTFAKIIITTYNGVGWYRSFKVGTATYRPLPVMRLQQFYSPKYNVKPLIIEADYRATLHWEPNINTDANGRAKISFYTSDIKGKYTVKIAGVDATGGIGDATIKLNSSNTLQ
jgi:hypothetical protein